MSAILVGGYNIGMLPVRKSFCQFATNSIRFLRRNLARLEGLAHLISDDLVLLRSPGVGLILAAR